MKRFMMFSVSILCLSIAVLIGFYVGSQRAEAQVGGTSIVGFASPTSSCHYVIMNNGDVWRRHVDETSIHYRNDFNYALLYVGNFFEGSGIVPTASSSWGDVKSRKK